MLPKQEIPPTAGEGAEDGVPLEAGKFEQRWRKPVRQSSKQTRDWPLGPRESCVGSASEKRLRTIKSSASLPTAGMVSESGLFAFGQVPLAAYLVFLRRWQCQYSHDQLWLLKVHCSI